MAAIRAARENPQKFCGFKGCNGGCHWCFTVREQRFRRPFYEAALRILRRRDLDDDVRTVAEALRDLMRPRIDEKRGRLIDLSRRTSRTSKVRSTSLPG
jgi:hypothetical protein